MATKKARVIAFYLPQYHPIPENDTWWGKGFTEWTNVGKAKPLYKGHYQPKVPADLGYYDLRLPEVREEQAKMAESAGIEGFCYWQYWFDVDKQLLERPFQEVLNSGTPDYPFCLGWANHSWTNKSWNVQSMLSEETILMEQTYKGVSAYTQHFYYNLKAFKDKRYICIEGKPVFVVYDPLSIPDVQNYINVWNRLAVNNGLKGIHFVGIQTNLSGFKIDEKKNKKYYLVSKNENSAGRYNAIIENGFDAVNSRGIFRAELMTKGRARTIINYALKKIIKAPILEKYRYDRIIEYLFVEEDKWENVYPTIIPNWDRSPRSGRNAKIWYGSTPELFGKHIDDALNLIKNKNDEHKIIFLQSWNEWAEGNYIEPDIVFGKRYLDTLRAKIIT